MRAMWLMAIALLGTHAGCARTQVIPPSLADRVDRGVSFAELKHSPSSFVGRYVVLGGTVLNGRWQKDGVRLEILQLPLEKSLEPSVDLRASQGRFLAIRKDFLDPATLPAGTRVTAIAEVTGAKALPLDEGEYVYPTVEIKDLTVWARAPVLWVRPYPYWGGYWGPYLGPYWAPSWVPPP